MEYCFCSLIWFNNKKVFFLFLELVKSMRNIIWNGSQEWRTEREREKEKDQTWKCARMRSYSTHNNWPHELLLYSNVIVGFLLSSSSVKPTKRIKFQPFVIIITTTIETTKMMSTFTWWNFWRIYIMCLWIFFSFVIRCYCCYFK